MDPVEQFRDLFVDSVRIRLRSDVEVGALLSGGLDSSAVAVAANRLLGATVRTYSIVADESRYSEARFIDMLARDGIPNRQVTFDVEGALDSLGDVVYHNDEPCFGLSIVAQYVMLKRIKQETGIKVVLSGQGADECLLGYHKFFFFYVQELLNRGRVLQAASLLLASLVQRTALWQFRLGEAQRYLPFQRLRRGNPYVLTEGELEPVHRGNGVVDRQRLDIDRYSVPLLTHFEDRNAMAHSIEMRNPFLDHRLVELALCLPVEMKLRGGWSKYVLRAALPELPAAIRWRRDKQGFITPEEQWLRAELRPVIEQAFTGENSLLGGMGILDPALFLASYRQFLAGDPRVWYADISRVFVAELWARRFLSAD
jgi:asparagine synthase (glutamine-hydrolysing)